MIVKVATEDWEFEQLFSLNYETFVEEIPQHGSNPEARLVDKFHERNTYLIALQDHQLVGMLAINDQRPFSLDQKLPDIDALLPPFKRPFEIRLLSVRNSHRGNLVFFKLFSLLNDIIEEKQFDIGLISGILSQQKMYSRIGFVPFGPLVGKEGAQFQPMYITYDLYRNSPAMTKLAAKL
jgi:hypothetical protein